MARHAIDRFEAGTLELERLEPRVLLTLISAMPLAEYLGADVPAGIVLEVEGASDTGNYLWSIDVNHEGDPDRVEWIRLADESVLTPLDVLGAEADIYSVSDNGLALWWNEDTDELWLTDLGAGLGAPLFAAPPDMIGGDFDYTQRPENAEAIEDGSVYIQFGHQFDGRVVLLGSGVMQTLWMGSFSDAGADRTAVGSRVIETPNDPNYPFRWDGVAWIGSKGELVATPAHMTAVNDSGVAISGGARMTYDIPAGMVLSEWAPPYGYSGIDITNADWSLVSQYTGPIDRGINLNSLHVLRAEVGFPDRLIPADVLVRGPISLAGAVMDDAGRLYSRDTVYTVRPLRDELYFGPDDVTIVPLADGAFLAAVIDGSGGFRTFIIRPDSVTAGVLFHMDEDFASDIELMIDPITNGAVLAWGDGSLSYAVYEETGDQHEDSRRWREQTPDDFLGAEITSFVTPDDRLAVVGRSADGELHIAFEIRPPDPDNSAQITAFRLSYFSNLTTEHLDVRGLSSPNYESDIIGYSTPWGGQNIAGLNADGEVEIVWWAPGLGDLWTTNNISKEIGAPKLVGNISAVATPWETINIVGTDADGTAWMLHWAPGFGAGNWRVTNLTEAGAGAVLESGSLTGHVTGWGGLVFTGIEQDTGRVASYWWEATIDRWVYEVLAPDEPAPIGALSSAASADEQSIVGVAEDGSLLRYWSTFESGWQVDNLSELAVI